VRQQQFPDRNTKTGKRIDLHLKGEQKLTPLEAHELFSENRWEKADAILDWLEEGVTVVLDRYAHSGVVYTIARMSDDSPGEKEDYLPMALVNDESLPRPDLVIYLDLDPEEAAKRDEYGKELHETLEFQKKVKMIYSSLAAQCDHHQFVVDASEEKWEVHLKVWNKVSEMLQDEKLRTSEIQQLW